MTMASVCRLPAVRRAFYAWNSLRVSAEHWHLDAVGDDVRRAPQGLHPVVDQPAAPDKRLSSVGPSCAESQVGDSQNAVLLLGKVYSCADMLARATVWTAVTCRQFVCSNARGAMRPQVKRLRARRRDMRGKERSLTSNHQVATPGWDEASF
jgi:hypothetical protein